MIGFKLLAREMPELVLRMRNICTMAAVLPLLAGCGPAPPAPEKLGNIVFDIRQMPGYEKSLEAPVVPKDAVRSEEGGSKEQGSKE